jgi:hypothetical protein
MKRTVTILILCLILTLTLPIFAAGASAESSELFSARDLSASYDEEVFSITLSGNTASTDSDHVTVSGGTVLMPLQGKDDEKGTPFVSLQPKSGLNGLSFWYPEQSTADPIPYPWTVRSLGADCWLVNTNIGNAWQGVDFLTNPSDNHYVNYLSGGMMRRGLQVGNSKNGTVIDVQFNPHYTHRLPSYLPHQKLPDFFAFIETA